MITKEQIEQAAHDDYINHEDSRRFEPFIAGAQWALEQDGWINVKDRLPDIGQCVLVYFHHRVQIMIYCREDDCLMFWTENKELYCYPKYWQPLPSPPKKESI